MFNFVFKDRILKILFKIIVKKFNLFVLTIHLFIVQCKVLLYLALIRLGFNIEAIVELS